MGRQIARLAAEGIKPCTLELGGHAPVLVFDDADLEKAVATCVVGKIRNAGQVCTSPTRFIVQEGIHDAFVRKYGEALDALSWAPASTRPTRWARWPTSAGCTPSRNSLEMPSSAAGGWSAGGRRAQASG